MQKQKQVESTFGLVHLAVQEGMQKQLIVVAKQQLQAKHFHKIHPQPFHQPSIFSFDTCSFLLYKQNEAGFYEIIHNIPGSGPIFRLRDAGDRIYTFASTNGAKGYY